MNQENELNNTAISETADARKCLKPLPPRDQICAAPVRLKKKFSFSKFLKRQELFFRLQWKNNFVRIVFLISLAVVITAIFMMIVERKSGMYNPDIDTNIFKRLLSSVYFTMVTVSTTGYGDYSPRTVPGRIFLIFFLVFNIAAIAVLSATITSLFVERRLKEGWGMGNMNDMKDHFIICGWKKNMAEILATMISASRVYDPKDIVVIANIPHELFDNMKAQNPELLDIRFIRGDYYNEVMLNKANIAMAKQIFILADSSDEKSSPSEIDSKTVMAAMTIHALNREIRVCAELLDIKYERYLVGAHVDEIIYANEYSRLILGISSDSAGISRVVNDILDLKTEARISTAPFPDEYIGKTYYELRVYFNQNKCANLLGLVENVGSLHKHKKESLREAQKTPDISLLVDSLKKVKTMISNNPNIHPDDDYVVPKNSLAVIISREQPVG